jgi:hypothetical protein
MARGSHGIRLCAGSNQAGARANAAEAHAAAYGSEPLSDAMLVVG